MLTHYQIAFSYLIIEILQTLQMQQLTVVTFFF